MFNTFPHVLAVDESRARNPIRQIGERGLRREGALPTFTGGRVRGFLFQPIDGGDDVLIIPRTTAIPDGHVRVVQATFDAGADAANLSGGLWLRHPVLNRRPGAMGHERVILQVLES